MNEQWSRRELLKQFAAISATLALPENGRLSRSTSRTAAQGYEIQVVPVSAHTVRLSVLPIKDGKTAAIPSNGALAHELWGTPVAKLRGDGVDQTVRSGNLRIHVSPNPLAFTVSTLRGETVQKLAVDAATGIVSFSTGNSPLLGLGEGGQQFD